jgi:hypothetical protein
MDIPTRIGTALMAVLQPFLGLLEILLSPLLAVALSLIYVSEESFVSRALSDFSGAFKFWIVGFFVNGLGRIIPKYRNAGWYRLHHIKGSCMAWKFFWIVPATIELDENAKRFFYNNPVDELYWSSDWERGSMPCLQAGPGIGLVFIVIVTVCVVALFNVMSSGVLWSNIAQSLSSHFHQL